MKIDRDLLLSGDLKIRMVRRDNGATQNVRVKMTDDKRGAFVSVKDSKDRFQYTGYVKCYNGSMRHTEKSRFSEDSVEFKTAKWVVDTVWNRREFPSGIEMDIVNTDCSFCKGPLRDGESAVHRDCSPKVFVSKKVAENPPAWLHSLHHQDWNETCMRHQVRGYGQAVIIFKRHLTKHRTIMRKVQFRSAA